MAGMTKAAGDRDRFDVADDAMFVVASGLSRRDAWTEAARRGGTVLPHEHTPDCGHEVNGK